MIPGQGWEVERKRVQASRAVEKIQAVIMKYILRLEPATFLLSPDKEAKRPAGEMDSGPSTFNVFISPADLN